MAKGSQAIWQQKVLKSRSNKRRRLEGEGRTCEEGQGEQALINKNLLRVDPLDTMEV